MVKEKTVPVDHDQYCSNCRFFSELLGECRKNAPEIALVITANKAGEIIKVESSGGFPPISGYAWCGQWESILYKKIPANAGDKGGE